MKTLRYLIIVVACSSSYQLQAEALCTTGLASDCPSIYLQRCDHVECVKYKCMCHTFNNMPR